MLRINVENVNEMVTLRCQGRVVRGHETAVLCAAMQQREGTVVLNLEEVDAIDDAGIGALVSLQAAGVYLILVNPSEQVMDALTITGLDSLFEICESQLTTAR